MKATFGVPALLAICLVAAQPEEPVQPTVQEAAVVVIGVSGDDVTAHLSVGSTAAGAPRPTGPEEWSPATPRSARATSTISVSGGDRGNRCSSTRKSRSARADRSHDSPEG